MKNSKTREQRPFILTCIAVVAIAAGAYLLVWHNLSEEHNTRYLLIGIHQSLIDSAKVNVDLNQEIAKQAEAMIAQDQGKELKRILDINELLNDKIDAKTSATNTSLLVGFLATIAAILGGYQAIFQTAKNRAIEIMDERVNEALAKVHLQKKIEEEIEEKQIALQDAISFAVLERKTVANCKMLIVGIKKDVEEMRNYLLEYPFDQHNIDTRVIEPGKTIAPKYNGYDTIFLNNSSLSFEGKHITKVVDSVPDDKKFFYYCPPATPGPKKQLAKTEETKKTAEPIDVKPESPSPKKPDYRLHPSKPKEFLNFANARCNIYPNLLDLLRMK